MHRCCGRASRDDYTDIDLSIDSAVLVWGGPAHPSNTEADIHGCGPFKISPLEPPLWRSHSAMLEQLTFSLERNTTFDMRVTCGRNSNRSSRAVAWCGNTDSHRRNARTSAVSDARRPGGSRSVASNCGYVRI